IRYVEITPTDRLVLARPSALTLRAIRSADAATLLMRGASDRTLDCDHPAVAEVEPHVVRLAPPAEELVPDVEGRAGVVLVAPALEVGALQDRLHDRPVAVDGEDLLLPRGVDVLDERLGRPRCVLRRHHRQLDQHRRLGDDELP